MPLHVAQKRRVLDIYEYCKTLKEKPTLEVKLIHYSQDVPEAEKLTSSISRRNKQDRAMIATKYEEVIDCLSFPWSLPRDMVTQYCHYLCSQLYGIA